MLELQPYTPVDVALRQIVEAHDLDVVITGGSGFGWSFYSAFQRCPRNFQLNQESKENPPLFSIESEGRAVGSLVHAFLAFYYNQVKSDGWGAAYGDASFVDWLKARLDEQNVNPKYCEEAWRVFCGYRDFWLEKDMAAKLEVLGTEVTAMDPKKRESCRYDLIARLHEDTEYAAPGVYVIEHKTASRFTVDLVEGWHLDGEIMGQAMLWPFVKKKYGKLSGVIVNLIGKQQNQQFQRILARVTEPKLHSHARSLRSVRTAIKACEKQGYFPQHLAGCVHRWGRCDHFEVCNG